MRQSLKQFKGKFVILKGKVILLDDQHLALRNISIDGFFAGTMDMFFVPVPSNMVDVCYEEYITIDTNNSSQKIKIGNYVSILGKLCENKKCSSVAEGSICDIRFIQKENKGKIWETTAKRAYCEQCVNFNKCSEFAFQYILKTRDINKISDINKNYYFPPIYELTYKKEGADTLRSLCELYPGELKSREKFINSFVHLLQTLEAAEAQKRKDNGCALTDEECKNITQKHNENEEQRLDDIKWKKFKKEYRSYNAVVSSEWGDIDFNFKNAKFVKNGNFKNKDEYLNAQRNKNSREWFSACYNYEYPASFIGRIEKFSKNKDKILFKRIRVCGDYMDGTCFDGKEDHVWMDAKGFKKFKPDDCVSFEANVYRYLRVKDNTIDYSLCNPEFIKKVESYSVPTDEELNEQAIEQIVCKTCLYNEQCYMGNCINPEYREKRIEELKKVGKNTGGTGIDTSLFIDIFI